MGYFETHCMHQPHLKGRKLKQVKKIYPQYFKDLPSDVSTSSHLKQAFVVLSACELALPVIFFLQWSGMLDVDF
jgi:hypothetical protein